MKETCAPATLFRSHLSEFGPFIAHEANSVLDAFWIKTVGVR